VAFWTKERIELEQTRGPLLAPYNADRIEQCAYALGVAAEYAITSAEDGGVKRTAAPGAHITIPPGQFALLLTEETITVPANAIALISMKARFKLRGLINVSGFHVDPGFSGRLKFAVYNTGGAAIDLKPGQELFLIWYCDLDQTTKALYAGTHQGQDGITAEDVMSIRGIVVSAAGVNERVATLEETMKADLRRLENKIDTHQNWSRPILTGIALGLVILLMNAFVVPWLQTRQTQPAPERTEVVPPPASAPASQAKPADSPRP
jgi:dCTP deaminase